MAAISKKTSLKPVVLSKTAAVDIIKNNAGRIMTVQFLKKDKTLRKMNFIHKKGKVTNLGYLIVWDIKKKEYRNVNPRTIVSINVNKTKFVVK